jgi:hypothetical protein
MYTLQSGTYNGTPYTFNTIDTDNIPDYFWPGGYAAEYVTSDGDILCGACVRNAFTDDSLSDHDMAIAGEIAGPCEAHGSLHRIVSNALIHLRAAIPHPRTLGLTRHSVMTPVRSSCAQRVSQKRLSHGLLSRRVSAPISSRAINGTASIIRPRLPGSHTVSGRRTADHSRGGDPLN